MFSGFLAGKGGAAGQALLPPAHGRGPGGQLGRQRPGDWGASARSTVYEGLGARGSPSPDPGPSSDVASMPKPPQYSTLAPQLWRELITAAQALRLHRIELHRKLGEGPRAAHIGKPPSLC